MDGLRVDRRPLSLRYEADEETLRSHFAKIAGSRFDLLELAQQIPDRRRENTTNSSPTTYWIEATSTDVCRWTRLRKLPTGDWLRPGLFKMSCCYSEWIR